MQMTSKALLALALSGSLAACSYSPSIDRQLGYEVDEGGFGQVSRTNTKIMSGEISTTQILANRFANEVPSTITFPFNSAELTPEARQVLAQQASWISQFPELRFSVYGHADAVGSNAYNQSLGKRRAQAVVNFFASQGVSRNRLEALVSFGETRPAVPSQGPEEANRRTVTTVSGFHGKRRSTLLDSRYAAIVYREYVAAGTRPHPANTDINTQVDPGER